MKTSVAISCFLHFMGLLLAMLRFDTPPDILDVPPEVYIPVDLVMIADQTNIRATIKAPIPELIKPVDVKTPAERFFEDRPTQHSDTNLSRPDEASADEESLLPAVQRPQIPTPLFDFDALSTLIDKSRLDTSVTARQKSPRSESVLYEFARANQARIGVGSGLDAEALTALRVRMHQCWRSSVDAKNPQNLSIRVRVHLYKDGRVETADLVEAQRIYNSGDGYLQLAAERALRAVFKCAPYDFLPSDKYESWKDMELNFQPES